MGAGFRRDVISRKLQKMDLKSINHELRHASAEEVVEWVVNHSQKPIATTSFGPNSAVLLHILSRVSPEIPVVWVDTGYNLRDTYVVAEKLIQQLQLNMRIYAPEMTSERRNAIMGGIPTMEDEQLHQAFTRQVKLDPFDRALTDLEPEHWISGIRQHETDHRKNLDIVSQDGRGIIKIAPLFYWSDEAVQAYMDEYQLPSCKHYFDPTKVHDGRECGLHTSA